MDRIFTELNLELYALCQATGKNEDEILSMTIEEYRELYLIHKKYTELINPKKDDSNV